MDEHLQATLIACTRRKARKAHVCQCGDRVKVGDYYTREFWIVEGEATTTVVADHIHRFERTGWEE